MSYKIRKILEKYVEQDTCCEYTGDKVYHIPSVNFDKLEQELQELMTKAVNKAYDNAKRKLEKES